MSDNQQQYQDVIKANIELHTKLSEHYTTCEPHFRPENIKKVEGILAGIISSVKAERMLDLGCGTGFMISIGKKYLKEICGVDVTQAMLDKVDRSGSCKIQLINEDTGTVDPGNESFDLVTAYSFLHHLYDIKPTVSTAFKALKSGGKFYADLDPNFYFWEGVNKLDRDGAYDPIVKREIEAVTYKDEDIENTFGVKKEVFNKAEFGKNISGGFREETLREVLTNAGFSKVEFFYHWYIGQGVLINDQSLTVEERFKNADVINDLLQKALPLSKNLFKYIGFVATK
jgi:ubiquinone/menaquinone biosynthesis C-methylase UbiE